MSSPTVAVCGRNCSITVGGTSYSAHKFDFKMEGKEDDVTSFGSSQFGDWLYCMINATVTVDCYVIPTLLVGDIVTVIMTFGFTPTVNMTCANSVIKGVTNSVDSKGIAQFTIEIRLTQVPSVLSS